MKTTDIKVGQIYKSAATNGFEWNDCFMNIDKIYKNGRIKVIIATAAVGKDTKVFDSSEVVSKIDSLNFVLIFNGQNLVK
jgi:hypothetical protein